MAPAGGTGRWCLVSRASQARLDEEMLPMVVPSEECVGLGERRRYVERKAARCAPCVVPQGGAGLAIRHVVVRHITEATPLKDPPRLWRTDRRDDRGYDPVVSGSAMVSTPSMRTEPEVGRR